MRQKLTRRRFLFASLLGASMVAWFAATESLATWVTPKPKGQFPMTLPDEEWKERLTPAAYDVLREEGTERAFTSPLNGEHRAGVYKCAGCGQSLYSSAQKFDSGTGWPSFWAPISETAVGTSTDNKLMSPRTEVHCSNCGGHLGHVFDDGPQPTGKRYCMNGVAMTFMPSEAP